MKKIILSITLAVLLVFSSSAIASEQSSGFYTYKSEVLKISKSVARDTGYDFVKSVQDYGNGNISIVFNDIVWTLSSSVMQQYTGALVILWRSIHGTPLSVTFYIGSARVGNILIDKYGNIVK